MKDLASKLAISQLFGPVVVAADQAAAVLDLQGYNSVALALAIGISGITFDGANNIEFTLEHSDDNVTYTNVTLADLNGKDVPASIINAANGASSIKRQITAHGAAAVYEFGYIGGKRFLRADIEFNGTHGNGTPISWSAIRSNAMVQPAV
jgi:hypothetical protein